LASKPRFYEYFNDGHVMMFQDNKEFLVNLCRQDVSHKYYWDGFHCECWSPELRTISLPPPPSIYL